MSYFDIDEAQQELERSNIAEIAARLVAQGTPRYEAIQEARQIQDARANANWMEGEVISSEFGEDIFTRDDCQVPPAPETPKEKAQINAIIESMASEVDRAF